MKIEFLKAGTGDCIIINHNSKNILIDGGNESTYLISKYYEIKRKNERIDYLIITHHDDDHIKGILDLFEEIEKRGENLIIDNVIFNSPRKILNIINSAPESNFLSYRQAYELENYLFIHPEINWRTSINNENLEEKLNELFNDQDLKFRIFSSSEQELKKYATNKGAYLTSDYRCDWDCPISILMKSIDDKSQDKSSSNKTSVVLLVTYKANKYLFTADVTPIRLDKIIDELREEADTINFELIKLSHHASYRSLNSEILKKINCRNFVISTNSKKHFLPNKRTVAKILNNRKSNEIINFYFNYGEVISNLKILKSEEKKYNFNLVANNKNDGYAFDI